MPPLGVTSFNYWSSKTPESKLQTDFFLPNGICVTLEISADASLANLKSLLWAKAKEYPRFGKLRAESEYVFSCVSRRGGMEELVDEERSLFDVKPFKPYIKVVKKQGDESEKLLNSKISMLIGKSLQDFNSMKVEEVEDFRMKYKNFCESIAQQRGRATWIRRAIYTFPPEFAETPEIPQYVQDKLIESSLTVNVVVVKGPHGTIHQAFSVHCQSYPSDLINHALRKKAATLKLREMERGEDFVLKIVGKESFLLGSTVEKDDEEKYLEYPLIQYKYIRDCICSDTRPHLSLVPKCELKVEDRARTFSLVDNPPPLPPKGEKNSLSLWDLSPETMFRIKIVCSANLNAGEMKKSVKCGLYHGGEPLCETKSTEAEPGANSRWNQFIDFNVRVIDLPRMARLCLCLYGYTDQKDKKKIRSVPLAWVNTTVFDYKGFLKTGPLRLYCWPCDSVGFVNHELHPLGTVVSNSSIDHTPCILVEFSKFVEPVMFPAYDKVLQLAADVIEKPKINPLTVKSSSSHRAQIAQIVGRDPLADLTEQDKELLWYLRAECCDDFPASLPKLLQSLKWNSREDVAQMQFLLTVWRKDMMASEHALELLDYKFSDSYVRKFSVDLLDELKDSELEQYLIQLVQALKHESYLDCALTRFLLKRALNNRRIGHFLFWNLRSEMHNPEVSVRFGLILEAYCRGSVGHLENLTKQYEAINKLKTVTELLQQSPLKDQKEKVELMRDCFRQPAYQRAFSNFTSPLDPSVQLKQLKVGNCKYMNSKKKPLWLVFENQDELAEDVILIFKNGDDLRQDMLTIQMLRIMDNIWKSQGLNLQMSAYGCLSTGPNLGVIEVVPDAETIAQIQVTKGSVKGAIKYDSLFSWLLQCIGKEPEDRKKAVFRFTQSCAGYCVATYVLGIGDRHNDNIMTKKSGNLLHIDFGHFLGNFKSKFGIRRERVPFVLTNDFIYVITDGKGNKDTASVENFKSLCYLAFQCLREKGGLFMTLFAIMLSSGIPELRSPENLDYLRQSLALTKSEKESIGHFEEIFKEAQEKSWTTSLNWVVHNIRHNWIV